jgi:hypothetical protein
MPNVRLAAKPPIVFLVLLGLCPSGCGKPEGPSSPSTHGSTNPSRLDQATSKEKLKIALDSWIFGDEPAGFREKHPDVTFLNTGYDLTPPVLQKYEIGEGRRREDTTGGGVQGYEFPVVLTLEGQGGSSVTKREVYSVRTQDNREWTVSINVP